MRLINIHVYQRISHKCNNNMERTSPEFYKEARQSKYLSTAKSAAVLPAQGSPKIRKLENKWNHRIGLPISTFNENVYPRYRITFNHL